MTQIAQIYPGGGADGASFGSMIKSASRED
jgi:hypothetical protein